MDNYFETEGVFHNYESTWTKQLYNTHVWAFNYILIILHFMYKRYTLYETLNHIIAPITVCRKKSHCYAWILAYVGQLNNA